MGIRSSGEALVLRENSEWLRYVFWGAAIGLSVLMVNTVNAPVREVGKIIGIAAGILLTAFSGFLLQTRTIVIDPLRREVVLTSKGVRQTATERLGFDEIKELLVLKTFDQVEDSRGVNVMRERWAIAFVLDGRSVPVTKNLYVTKESALRDARKMQALLAVDITDDVDGSPARGA
jgi:hypothetical protein